MTNNISIIALATEPGANDHRSARDGFADALVSLRGPLYQRALFLAQDRAAADDLMQETFERALQSWRQFLAGSNLRAWLFSIMRNLFIDDRRRDARARREQQAHQIAGRGSMSTTGGDEGGATSATGGDVAAWGDETANRDGEPHCGPFDLLLDKDVDAALATLRPAQREMFVLAYRERVSHRQIAARLEVSIGTIATRLFRVRARLRSRLEDVYRQRRRDALNASDPRARLTPRGAALPPGSRPLPTYV